MKHYYKISTRSETGKQLRRFNSQAILALRRANAYAKRMGAIAYHSPNDSFAGGVSFLVFDKEPSPAVWRVACKIDGELCYEPNVKLDSGVKIVKKNSLPDDEPDCIYNRSRLLSWDDVRQRYSLSTWARTANIRGYQSMPEEELQAEVVKRMKDRHFISYLRFSDMPSPDLVKGHGVVGKQGKQKLRIVRPMVKVLSRAVTAEQQRMALPVLSVSSLMEILSRDNSGESMQDCNTMPIFFDWDGHWYVGVDFPCTDNQDLTAIDENAFKCALNTKKQTLAREAAEFDEYCQEEKAEREREKEYKAQLHSIKKGQKPS